MLYILIKDDINTKLAILVLRKFTLVTTKRQKYGIRRISITHS